MYKYVLGSDLMSCRSSRRLLERSGQIGWTAEILDRLHCVSKCCCFAYLQPISCPLNFCDCQFCSRQEVVLGIDGQTIPSWGLPASCILESVVRDFSDGLSTDQAFKSCDTWRHAYSDIP